MEMNSVLFFVIINDMEREVNGILVAAHELKAPLAVLRHFLMLRLSVQ